MKLYTEEQVRQAYIDGMDFIAIDPTMYEQDTNEYMTGLTPITLPSDEEIELKSVEYSTDTETKEFYEDCCWDFQNGVKWVIDKIQGGNK